MNCFHVLQRVCVAAKAAVVRALFLGLILVIPAPSFAAFGLTTSTDFYTVDTGAGLVFDVRRTEPANNQQTQGDISSIIFNGVQYQDQVRGSQVGIGIGGGTVSADTDGSTYVKITVTAPDGDLTHYYIARNGYANIYMGTYFNSEPSLGNVRYITRIPYAVLPNGPAPSDTSGNIGAIESGDVFGLANGESRSKHYSGRRQMDWSYTGATSPTAGIWMVKGNNEGMSGGPFYRSLINQAGAGGDQEIYELINYGEAQTEAYRTSILNLYTLVFTDGSAPGTPDLSWMDPLGLLGWVPASARGGVSGTTAGVPAAFQTVVGFANATAQYWAVATNGSYSLSGMIPGVYTATLFKGELAVATDTVTVTAGSTATLNLASTETIASAIFRIGEWDGTPAGFLNADKITTMHPSDSRMSPWTTTTFNAGTDAPILFPSIQTRAANSPFAIKFNLAPNQITNLTLKIGITIAYNSGRPQVTVNNSFTTPVINASNQPSTRSFTVGTYRGNNTTFTFTIPASALVVGTNTMTINPISGSADLSTWLSAGWVYDAVELDGPIATPGISYVGGNPLVISGTAEPSRNLTVMLDGSTVLGTTIASATGTWSLVTNVSIPVGSHTVTAVADDGAGHASPASAAFAFDSGIAMPAIVSAVGDTGTYVSGATTSDRVFAFSGTAGPGNTVTLIRIGTGNIGTTTANGSGGWTFDYTGVSLPDGVNSFYATASNGGGNSASSSIFTLTLAGAPRVAITRFDPAASIITTGVGSLVYRVTFNHEVSGVTASAFALTTTGTAAGTITGVSAASGSVFDVTVANLTGDGNLRLDLKPASGIVDAANNPEAGFSAGEIYSLVIPSFGNGTWVQPDSGGLWSDPLNWLNAVVAEGVASTANFGSLDLLANNTVHLDGVHTLNGITFADTAASSTASWIVDNNGNAANTLALAGATPTVTVGTLGTGATATISAGLTGTAGLAKAGVGTLVLAGPSSLTGPLNVNVGNIQIVPGASLALGNSAVNTATNSVFNVTGGSFSAGGLTSIATSLIVDGGTVNLGSFRTNATFGTLLKVTGGAVTIGDINLQRTAGTAPDFNSGLIVTGGSLTATTLRVGTSNSYANVSVEGTGALTVTGAMTIGNQASAARGGAMRVLGGTFTSTDTTLGVVLGRTSGTNANNVAAATFTGGVSTVEKFTLGYDSTVTAGSSTITVNGGALYVGSGGIVKNGTSGLVTNLNFSSGTLGAKASWSTALPVTLPTGGNIALTAADVSATPFDIALTGAISGAGGFTKTGAGTLTLAGVNTYTGTTAINAGTLNLTGSLSAAANPVTVNSGGTLAGTGLISRSLTLNAGGTIAPAGAGAIGTINGASLGWNSGGVLSVDLGASGTSDQLALSGAFSRAAAGGYTIAFAPAAGFGVGNVYTIATFASTNFTAADFSATGLPTGTGAWFIVNSSNLQVRIQGTPSITSATVASGVFGTPFSYKIESTETPVTFGATGLPGGLTVDSATGIISGTPASAGNFEVTIIATNSAGVDHKTLTIEIARAPASVLLGNLNVTYDGAPHPVSVVTAPPGVAVAVTYSGSVTPPTNAGSYAVVATVVDANYFGGATGTLTIAKATATIDLAPLTQRYDGTPKLVAATTTPADLDVNFTYDGVTAGPIYPGTHTVVATIDDENYEGSKTGTLVITITALVRHAPTFNGIIDGSIQVLLPESLTLNSSASLSGDLLLPGTPSLQLNGTPMLAGTKYGPGVVTPTNYTVTLNSGAVARYVVRRVNAITLPAVAAPNAPTGTRSVTLNSSGQSAGNFATLRNLTLNSSTLQVTVPPGAYGNFTANSGKFVLGIAGATEPAVYYLQNLAISSGASVQIAGPVIVVLANGVTFNGIAGNAAHPEWFTLQIYSGGVTVNSSGMVHGTVIAPNGTVTLNATLHGNVSSDRLVLNGNALLDEPTP